MDDCTAFCNIMDKSDLVKLVASKTGLNEEMATLAVNTVFDFIKQKLPPEFAGQLEGLLSAGGGEAGASGILGKLGGLFGKKDS